MKSRLAWAAQENSTRFVDDITAENAAVSSASSARPIDG
jgi:hypothetical protein